MLLSHNPNIPFLPLPQPGLDGAFQLIFGTSASSPVVGSMITLINDARLAAGKGPVGFLNPSVYSRSNTP